MKKFFGSEKQFKNLRIEGEVSPPHCCHLLDHPPPPSLSIARSSLSSPVVAIALFGLNMGRNNATAILLHVALYQLGDTNSETKQQTNETVNEELT